MNQDIEKQVRELQNKMCIDGHLNKALDSIMASSGVVGGPDAVFNILGDLAETAIRMSLGAPFLDREAKLHEAMDKLFKRTDHIMSVQPSFEDTMESALSVTFDPEIADYYTRNPRLPHDAEPGTRCRFDARGGYELEKESAGKVLELGKWYTVSWIDAGSFSSAAHLVEVPNRGFNTCLFAVEPTQTNAVEPN